MSDRRLREAEAAWLSSQSSEDETAWLQARVQVGERLTWGSYSRLAELDLESAARYLERRVEQGDLARERVQLAARLRHKPAELLVDSPGPLEGAFATCLSLLTGREVISWACDCLEALGSPDAAGTEAALSALRTWVACPCHEHSVSAEEAALAQGGDRSPFWFVAFSTYEWDEDDSPKQGRYSFAAGPMLDALGRLGTSVVELARQRDRLCTYLLGGATL